VLLGFDERGEAAQFSANLGKLMSKAGTVAAGALGRRGRGVGLRLLFHGPYRNGTAAATQLDQMRLTM
jgi:hypothetical protein